MNFASMCGIGWFQIFRLFEYPLYFYLGFLFESKGVRERLVNYMHSVSGIVSTIAMLLLLALTIGLVALTEVISMHRLLLHLIGIIQALLGSLFIFIVALYVVSGRLIETKMHGILKKYNFAIYLYHEPLQFFMLWTLMETGVLQYFNNNGMYVLLCVLRFFATIAISIVTELGVEKAKSAFKIICGKLVFGNVL